MKREPLRVVDAMRHERDQHEPVREMLAEETPVALVYNGHSHAVMMATPADLDDFAYGFSLSEGIVDGIADIEIIDRITRPQGISLQMMIPRPRALALADRQRSLSGRTGCGLCGSSSLESAIRPVRRVSRAAELDVGALLHGFLRLRRSQSLNERCGALHAAALLSAGDEMLVREDVGRHNAVDKVIGAGARANRRPQALLVTSRASYEVVHKAAQADCPLVAAISAPTALAVRLAEEAGITLIGFARNERMTVYAGSLRAVREA